MEKPCRRRKIEFVEDSRAHGVSFVKRWGGLFRKASELGILCGAQCAIITFSERGTPFVFGRPSPDAVIDRFFGGGGGICYGHAAPPLTATTTTAAAMKDRTLSEAVGSVESNSKKKKRKLNNDKDNVNGEDWRGRFWWDDDELIDDMEKVEELELYTSQVRELRKKVRRRMEEIAAAPEVLIQTPAILTDQNNDDRFS